MIPLRRRPRGVAALSARCTRPGMREEQGVSGRPTTPRRRRRVAQPPISPIVPGDQDLVGTRETYQLLAAHARILSWSLDQFFPEREKRLWEALRIFALRRNLPVAWQLSPAEAKPIQQSFRTGDRQRYRLLASQLTALAGYTGPDFLAHERRVWDELEVLAVARGLATISTGTYQ